MQETRKHILEILRLRNHATVDEIVDELQRRRGSITSVTVRHHLLRLQKEGLISTPELKRRVSPGRPQHVYTLTPKAKEQFPGNYHQLAAGLLDELCRRLPESGVNVILEGVADQLAQQADIPVEGFEERLHCVVEYLTRQGYEARWETSEDGYILHTTNCPYHQLGDRTTLLCTMDMRLIASLLGVVPRRIKHVAEGDDTCSYLLPVPQANL